VDWTARECALLLRVKRPIHRDIYVGDWVVEELMGYSVGVGKSAKREEVLRGREHKGTTACA